LMGVGISNTKGIITTVAVPFSFYWRLGRRTDHVFVIIFF
jgi:hypothetical protein